MTSLFGRNSLDDLDVSLPELYTLRRSGSNTIVLPDVDRFLSFRPDYIIWRLIRERQPHTILSVPAEMGGGIDLFLDCLKRAAASSDPDIKWAAYGLVARTTLIWANNERGLRFVRMPSKLSRRSIPEGDRVTDSILEQIVNWLRLRHDKFSKAAVSPPEFPLRSNRRQSLPREQLIDAEQFLLLALGQLSIWLASIVLGERTDALEAETFKSVRRHLSTANGGWWPGQPVYAQNLQHFRSGYGSNIFSSCYLPFGIGDYNDWIADALARWSASIEAGTNAGAHRALFLGCSNVLHREWLFSHTSLTNRKARGRPLLISLDRTAKRAAQAEKIIMMGGLAARYLAVGNQVGWDHLGRDRDIRIVRGRYFKAVAKMAGCVVEGDAESLDFSTIANKSAVESAFDDPAEEYRFLFRRATPTQMQDQPESLSSTAVEDDSEEQQKSHWNEDLAAVAAALRMPPTERGASSQWLRVLRIATICLTPGKGENVDDLYRLLAVEAQLFRAFLNASLVGGIALLAERLKERGRLGQSVFGSAHNVVRFASLLLMWLERPYMADLEVRSGWQKQLLLVYTHLSPGQRRDLSLDNRLLIYAAVSHVTAAVMKSLGETEADQLEDSIYEDSGEMDARFRGLTTKSDLRVRKSELESILRQLQYRAKNAAGFVQIVLSPHGKSATVLLACLLKDGLVWREESVEFIPGRHLLNDYDSWVDVVAEVDNFDYSNSDTGSLNSYAVSPLGQPSVRLLWKRTLEALSDINGGGTPEHLLFVSDSALASIPWQLVAMENPDDQGVYPIVTMVHGLRWLYLSAHIPEEVPKYERFHDRGIQVWIADTPTPREDLDIRDQVKAAFFDAQADSPSLTDVPGVSLSVVFGHGAMLDGSPMPANEAVRRPQDWHDVRDSRICVLLSCYTGAGTPGALGDYLSISHKLCRTSKALIAPPVKVPYTAALAIAEVFHQAMRASVEGATWRILDVYREALRRDPAVALFSLWGISYEPLVWKPRHRGI